MEQDIVDLRQMSAGFMLVFVGLTVGARLGIINVDYIWTPAHDHINLIHKHIYSTLTM